MKYLNNYIKSPIFAVLIFQEFFGKFAPATVEFHQTYKALLNPWPCDISSEGSYGIFWRGGK